MQKLVIGVPSRVLDKHCRMRLRGFTLLELLIVLVIIGVVIAAVTWSISNSGNGQKVRSAANILRARLVFAEQQAITQATTVGFAISQQGYQFYHLSEQSPVTWATITKQQALKFHAWAGDFEIILSLPNNPNALVPNTLPGQPVIVFTPSGGVTPFTLRLDNFVIKGKNNGEITIGPADA